MDDPPSFSLMQAFPPTQVTFLVLAPVALYIAAFVSRPRLVTIQKLPRYGSSMSQPSAPVPTHPDKDASEPSEKDVSVLLKSEEPQEDNGIRIVKIERQSSRLHTAFRWALCAGLVAADAAFVYAVVETVWDVYLCLCLSAFVACLAGVVAVRVVGGSYETLARKPDGSVVSGIAATSTKGSLHPMYYAAIYLVGFAIVPSLVLSPLAYPFIPLAMIALGACAVGSKVQLKHMILFPYIMTVAALMLGSVIATITYFITSSNDGESSSGNQKENVHPSFWSLDPSTPFQTTAYQEVLPLSMAAPLVQLVACLYRYDRTPTLDELDAMKILLLPIAATLPGEEVEPKALILPMVWIVRQRLIALKGIKPTLNYSNLAVLITMLWVALLPVVIEALFPQLPIASLIASLRTISLFCALLTIPAAVLFVAWFRGEARKVWAYEEDWGVKIEPEREA